MAKEERQECRDYLLGCDGLLGVVLCGFLVHSEALGSDGIAFFDDVFDIVGADYPC